MTSNKNHVQYFSLALSNSFYSALSFWLHLNNSKSQISQHLIRINQREIEKNVQNLPALFQNEASEISRVIAFLLTH